MAPAIIQLEISRISNLQQQFFSETDFYNALVKARFELKQFVEGIERTIQAPVPDDCSAHLREAIVALSLQGLELNKDTDRIVHYVLDRLNYVYDRISFIY